MGLESHNRLEKKEVLMKIKKSQSRVEPVDLFLILRSIVFN